MIPMTDISSVRRRFLLIVLMVAFTVGIIETLSFVLLGLIDKGVPTWSSLQSERRIVAENEGGLETSGEIEGALGEEAPTEPGIADDEVNKWMLRINNREVIHPYIGFVEQPRDNEQARSLGRQNAESEQYGFPRNAHGIFFEPGPDRLVVAVVGGSFSRQIGYGGRRLIEEGLEASDRFRGRDVIVVALGLGGYKEPQQLMVVNYFLAIGMHIDVLVNIDGFNEVVLPVTENAKFNVNPFFPRAWNIRVADLDPVGIRMRGKIEHYRDLRAHQAVVFSRAPWRYSMTCSLVWRLLDRRALRLADRVEVELRDRDWDHGGFQAMGPDYDFDSDIRLAEDLVRVWRRCSVLLERLARSNGIEYYHFLQPNQYVEGSKRMGGAEQRVAINPDSGIFEPVSRGYPLLRESASDLRAAGVTFVDLTPVFSGVDEAVYIDDCCHVNEIGIELVVDRLIETVAAGG